MSVRYTQHEKLSKVSEESQTIGEFIEWLQVEKGYTVGEFDKYDTLQPVQFNIQDVLAEYFGINLNKFEEEKRHMLTYMRGLNSENE